MPAGSAVAGGYGSGWKEITLMAGIGPAPKPSSRRARTNADPVPTTVLRFVQGVQPALPGRRWPVRTREWWSTWGESAQAELFSATDWDFLLDTAVLHARFWRGDVSVAAELRLRVAKFGATMEDRARLRMQFAQADEADARRPAGLSSRERYGDLRVLRGADAVEAVESG